MNHFGRIRSVARCKQKTFVQFYFFSSRIAKSTYVEKKHVDFHKWIFLMTVIFKKLTNNYLFKALKVTFFYVFSMKMAWQQRTRFQQHYLRCSPLYLIDLDEIIQQRLEKQKTHVSVNVDRSNDQCFLIVLGPLNRVVVSSLRQIVLV